MSRPLSVNQSDWSSGLQSKPTVLRTPRATTCGSLPSGFMRRIWPWAALGTQTLHGAPTPTYSSPSGPKPMNFAPWCVSLGRRSVTSTGSGGFCSRSSIASRRTIFETADT